MDDEGQEKEPSLHFSSSESDNENTGKRKGSLKNIDELTGPTMQVKKDSRFTKKTKDGNPTRNPASPAASTGVITPTLGMAQPTTPPGPNRNTLPPAYSDVRLLSPGTPEQTTTPAETTA